MPLFTENSKHPLLKAATFTIFFLIGTLWQAAAQTATIKGAIVNEEQLPIEGVAIYFEGGGTQSDISGFYELTLPAEREITLVFSHLTYKKITLRIALQENEVYEFNPIMQLTIEQFGEVFITSKSRKSVEGVQTISPEKIRRIPGANAGVETVLKLLPGVNSNNELSTQYSVRGGNYDENLVYVNGIEVYRPFLIRSGQQEGLSFVNTQLVRNVDFSSGGFQAKYGDKLSSVLDISYKKPVAFKASLEASLLGGGVALENASKNGRLTTLLGVRYRDNSLLVNSQQTETNFKPRFADAQTYITYQLSAKLRLDFLGGFSVNDYDYQPLTRQTNFGTLQNPIALLIFYEGREKDVYTTTMGALKTTYFPSEDLTLSFTASAYHAIESEHFDILAQYRLGEVNSVIGGEELGEVEFSEGIGSQLNHARNDLDAFILNLTHRGILQKNKHRWEWGITYTSEDIRDRLREYEVIDSAGFSLRPPFPEFANNQPYEPFNGSLQPFQSISALNFITINRLSGYAQWSARTTWGDSQIWYNIGLRSQVWHIAGEDAEANTQAIVSPRIQLALKPAGERDLLFRIAGGWYHQPPFYRELRDSAGVVNPSVKAQRSLHLVAGNEYSFRLWERPFKLITEAYYKNLANVNPYTLENVRIRYRANNSARAYAYGLDVRLNGEFVPGTESWVSIGYLKTEETINEQGYIPRPTDQRLKAAILFQDYVPSMPNLKMYLNLVYNTGLPGGSPSYANPYQYQARLRDYKRADLGISYLFVDATKPPIRESRQSWCKELSAGFEIFNIFDVQNAITNTWVRDVYTKRQFGVPNYMTGRVFNVKINIEL